ncbi:uncharacterized protein LOC129616032 isoform X2 [Condylostylus longicornis]|nr:uncharacterized protein LOC129616032 isoform X2 [Condylostylus longicornis]XP_055387438.1 uncharacterized protein LOC129616032 isoform X2 [Condylostylus longicornis]
MISIDNMILFIFITVCIFFGVGISAILRIYSRRHQRNIDTEDPFCTTGDSNQFRRNQQLLDTNEFTNRNNNIFVIDVGNDTFYKGPPPPKYGEEMPPSYEDAIRNVALITTGTTTTTTCTNDNITINTTNTTNITERNSTG